jgi:hypothetical protein
MSIADLFKSNLKDSKPLAKKTSSTSNASKSSNASAPVSMHQLFSKNHTESVADVPVDAARPSCSYAAAAAARPSCSYAAAAAARPSCSYATAAVNQEEQNKDLTGVPSLLSFKLTNVPSRSSTPVPSRSSTPVPSRDVQPTESVNVSKGASDLEQVRSLNTKYIQVINQINEELMKLKSDATKTTAENASLKTQNKDLSNKISELSNAVLNVVQQNKTLSRALGLRS